MCLDHCLRLQTLSIATTTHTRSKIPYLLGSHFCGGSLQVFGDERAAVIEGLPSLEDSSTFFQTQSNGPATASLEDMQQDIAPPSSSDDEEAAEDTDHTDLPVPKAAKPAGQSRSKRPLDLNHTLCLVHAAPVLQGDG